MTRLEKHERIHKRDWRNRSLSRTGQMSWGNWFIQRREQERTPA